MKPENVKCPECQGEMIPRKSKYGTFWGCKNYPKCKGTRDVSGLSKEERDETYEGEDNKEDNYLIFNPNKRSRRYE